MTRSASRPPRPIAAHNLKVTRGGKVKKRNLVWRLRRWLFLAGLLVVIGAAGVLYVLSRVELPSEPPVEDQTTFVCDASVPAGQCTDDNAFAVFHGEQNRVYVTLDKIPEVMQNAVLAAEDRDFFKHGGVDPLGIARAAWADIRDKGSKQGGSTITQQYVKTVYLTRDRTLGRKLKEAAMAVKFEQKYSKEDILERYLNTIYFGRGAYGVQAASRAYFGHDVSKITVPEAALLAGLIRSPARAEPYTYPAEAKRRRRTVLAGMVKMKTITQKQYRAADRWPFDPFHNLAFWTPSLGVEVLKGANINDPKTYAATQYFVESVRAEMIKQYGVDTVFGGGLRIYTTLDLNMQKAAYQAVTQTLNQPNDPAGALVAIDDQGQVKAMMGGTNYRGTEPWAQVNLATGDQGGGGGRQPGSTFKAFALAEAVKEGYSIESVFTSPSHIDIPQGAQSGNWGVSGGCCGGRATLVQATQMSVNTVYAQLMVRLGAQNVVDMAHDLGVKAPLSPAYPSFVLGSGEVSVLDMAAGYSTFANQGVRVTPRIVTRVERADNTVLRDFPAQRTQVLTAGQTAKVVYCLQRVVEFGTGRTAQIGRDQAGKTGTTQDNADAWFAGFTPRLTAAVWMGHANDNKSMGDVHGLTVQGGNLPAQIWKRFMELSVANIDTGTFPPAPADLEDGANINPELSTTTLPPATQPPPTDPAATTTTKPKKPGKPGKKPKPTASTAPPGKGDGGP